MKPMFLMLAPPPYNAWANDRLMVLKTACVASLAFLAARVDRVGRGKSAAGIRVAGSKFDGSRYSGTVDITISSNTACTIVWHTGGEDLTGVCMRDADSFAAAYVADGEAGLVLYTVEADGTLNGVWTVADQNGVGTDVLTPERFEPANPPESVPSDAPGGGHGNHHGP